MSAAKFSFPFADHPTAAELNALGSDKAAAVKSGEFRPPNKGEWYLSGAIPEAYRARVDLSGSFWVLRLVPLVPCPHCGGTGRIVDESNSQLLSLVIEAARAGGMTAHEFASLFNVDHDRLNNGGIGEIVDLLIREGDDIEWIGATLLDHLGTKWGVSFPRLAEALDKPRA